MLSTSYKLWPKTELINYWFFYTFSILLSWFDGAFYFLSNIYVFSLKIFSVLLPLFPVKQDLFTCKNFDQYSYLYYLWNRGFFLFEDFMDILTVFCFLLNMIFCLFKIISMYLLFIFSFKISSKCLVFGFVARYNQCSFVFLFFFFPFQFDY